MNVALGYVNVLEPYTTTRGALYNGNTLLGVSTSRYTFFI